MGDNNAVKRCDWPGQAVRSFREEHEHNMQCGLVHRDSSRTIEVKARSLEHVNKVTVNMEDVEEGYKDIAELRSDGTGAFYSNFTPQGFDMPRCLAGCSMLHQFWSIFAFMVNAAVQLLFNWEAIFMCLSGLGSTLLCSENFLDFRATYQTSALFIGLIFPLVFLIGQTWTRREKAIERLASIKANSIQLVLKLLMHRQGGAEQAIHVVEIVRGLIDEIRKYLPQDANNSGLRVCSIYGRLAELQAYPECVMLTRFILVEFEKLRAQREYRTPWKLNYFVFVFGTVSPVLCGPLFASMGCHDRFPARPTEKSLDADGLSCDGYGTVGAYLSAFFFALVICSLLSVVKAMEDPFSLSGPDDVIAHFSFEANALLALIEDRFPGSLAKTGSMAPVSPPKLATPRTIEAMAQLHIKQAQVADEGADEEDEEAAGGGEMN